MRGRTNVGGGSNFFADGNTVYGIVDERNGIVSGDFVERTVTKKELECSTNPAWNSGCISQPFKLSNGSYCTFFREDYFTSSSEPGILKAWFSRIENGEMLDDGIYEVILPIILESPFFKMVQVSENTFLFAAWEVYAGDITKSKPSFILITITGNVITAEKIGEGDVITSYDENYYNLKKLSDNKFLVSYKDKEDSEIGQRIGSYIITLSGKSLSFGAKVFITSSNYIDTVIYEDGHIAVFYATTGYVFSVDLFRISGSTITFVKTYNIYQNSSSNYITGVAYIGNSRILIANRKGAVGGGQILTLTESSSGMSADIEIAQAPFTPANFFFRESGGKLFAIAENTTTSGSRTTKRYAIGILNTSSIGGMELTDVYSEEVGSSNYNWIICGVCSETDELLVSILRIFTSSGNYTTKLKEIGYKVSGYNIESLEEKTKFKKYASRIDGVSKQSGANGDIIEVYVPN